jgi:putative ABC transport system permease protein
MIGVMLLALVATFTESLKSVVTAQFSQTSADFFVIGTAGAIPPGALNLIEDVDGVDVVTSLGITVATVDDVQYTLAAIDPATAELAFDYNSEPEFDQMNGGVFIDNVVAATGVEVGDEITITGAEGTQTLEVTGRYLTEGDANLWVDFPTAEALVGEVTIPQAMVVLEEGVDVDEAQTQIQDVLREEYPFVILQQPGQLEQFANQFIDLLLGVISALLASALVIAILGVANTLLLSVTERTREIGLLRAVGLKKRSVWRMITVESMVMAIFGTILGMILGVSLGAALVIALEDFGFNGPTIPWVWLAVYTVLAAIAGVVAAIWPAWRASRLDILQAIAADG